VQNVFQSQQSEEGAEGSEEGAKRSRDASAASQWQKRYTDIMLSLRTPHD
jgi:hypothetical protein